MHTIGNSIWPSAAHRMSQLMLNAARTVLLLFSRLKRSSAPERRNVPDQPRPGRVDDLGEDNQLL